jgi:hypothetical protein
LEEIAVLFDGEAAHITAHDMTKSYVFSADMPVATEQEDVSRKV